MPVLIMFRIILCCLLIIFSFSAVADKPSSNIKELQKQMVSIAKRLRVGESELARLANKQAKLDARTTDARTKIDENREEIDTLLQSLIRLSRTPPEAVIAMPGELRQTLQAAQLMTNLTEQMQTKTRSLTSLLKKLKSDELALAETRSSLQQQNSRLIASQKALAKKLEKRKTEYRKNNKDFAKQIKQASRIKKSSHNVKQLVKKLEKKRKRKTAINGLVFTKSKGRLDLPVAGRITKYFGQKDGVDQTSRGYHLASATGATVVSPASGEVMFTGPFLDYGNIVILRFDRGYHLLLSGLYSIDCSVGQKVISGEPIGRLKAGKNSKADLYMELRKNGKAIDPSPWFS